MLQLGALEHTDAANTTQRNSMFFFISFESNQIFLIDFDPLITNLARLVF
jgi:hypothetical protein